MTATPEGLTPGPDGTFYGELRHVPNGWEYRHLVPGHRADWDTERPLIESTSIVQARPAPLDLPTGIRFGDAIVTVWDEMRDRPDLDKWECATPYFGWRTMPTGPPATDPDIPDDFPLIVRRKDSGR